MKTQVFPNCDTMQHKDHSNEDSSVPHFDTMQHKDHSNEDSSVRSSNVIVVFR